MNMIDINDAGFATATRMRVARSRKQSTSEKSQTPIKNISLS